MMEMYQARKEGNLTSEKKWKFLKINLEFTTGLWPECSRKHACFQDLWWYHKLHQEESQSWTVNWLGRKHPLAQKSAVHEQNSFAMSGINSIDKGLRQGSWWTLLSVVNLVKTQVLHSPNTNICTQKSMNLNGRVLIHPWTVVPPCLQLLFKGPTWSCSSMQDLAWNAFWQLNWCYFTTIAIQKHDRGLQSMLELCHWLLCSLWKIMPSKHQFGLADQHFKEIYLMKWKCTSVATCFQKKIVHIWRHDCL